MLIKGVNFGNWLVLEKWMSPELFDGIDAEDEVWMNRVMDQSEKEALLKKHRDTYITEQDFRQVADWGLNLIRLPVPFFVFGDRAPYVGCIEYVDRAFGWAEKYGVQILLDLHTVPGSQNGYDNGGITGVCKWCKNPEEVEFALTVLERLAKRYGDRSGLYGIEVLNEPISWVVYRTAPSTGKARDKEEARGSSYVPMKFLKPFYIEAYKRLRKILPEEKVIVFHDGFRLGAWKDFFEKCGMKNVMIDTHIYISAMEGFFPFHFLPVYKAYVWYNKRLIQKTAKHTPVVVGEWNIVNKRALIKADKEKNSKQRRQVCREEHWKIEDMEKGAWESSAGWIYWSYKLHSDRNCEDAWKDIRNTLDGWDFSRTVTHGWWRDSDDRK